MWLALEPSTQANGCLRVIPRSHQAKALHAHLHEDRSDVALRYMPATSHFDRSLKPSDGQTGVPVNFARRPIWLVQGVDRCGLNDFEVGHAG